MEGRTVTLAKKHSSEEEKKSATKDLPPLRILTVSNKGAVFYRLQEGNGTSADDKPKLVVDTNFPSYPTATLGKFAPYSGRIAVIAEPSIGLHVVDCSSGRELRLIINQTAISSMSFSPRDSYIITCEKYVQGKGNLIVWNLANGIEIGQFEWKKGSKEGTKSIKFTEDERFCARLSSRTQIEVFEGGNFTEPKARINASAEFLAKKTGGK